MSPYKINKAQLLSQTTKTKRLLRAKLLLENLRDGTQPSFLWTDEKLFTVQAVYNPQNNRIYAVNKSDIALNADVSETEDWCFGDGKTFFSGPE